MGDSVENLVKVELDDIHCSSPCLHFIINATRGDTTDTSQLQQVSDCVYPCCPLSSFFYRLIILPMMKFELTDLHETKQPTLQQSVEV